jgi:hypothetical protein
LFGQGCLIFLAALCLLGEIGYTMARRTGIMGVGAWSAGLAGACFGLGDTLGSLGTFLAKTITLNAASRPTPATFVAVLLLQAFNNTLVYGLLGIIASLIGAAIGRSQFRARQRALQNAQNAQNMDPGDEPARDSE